MPQGLGLRRTTSRGNFSVLETLFRKVSLAGIEPVGFRTKSDLRNHQAIVQPRLYDCLMVTQITLSGFVPVPNCKVPCAFFCTRGCCAHSVFFCNTLTVLGQTCTSAAMLLLDNHVGLRTSGAQGKIASGHCRQRSALSPKVTACTTSTARSGRTRGAQWRPPQRRPEWPLAG